MAETSAAGKPSEVAHDVGPPLPVVCNFWREFDLESIRSKLDGAGLKIASFQDEASRNRRKLAEATRSVKRVASEEVSKALGPLLKQYQEEIDRLSKRAKHGEAAFLELYKKLYEAPDPAPALVAAVEMLASLTDLEAANSKMARELADFKSEAKSIRNQDLTIRRLEEKVKDLQEQLRLKDAEMQRAAEEAAAAADANAIEEMRGRERRLEVMLEEAQASLSMMQKLHQASQNQLFELQTSSEEAAAGRQTELDLTTQELDRAQQRMQAIENEKRMLQQRLQAAVALSSSGGPADVDGASGIGQGREGAQQTWAALEAELEVQRRLVASLREENLGLREQSAEAEEAWEARLEGNRMALEAEEARRHALEHQLALRPSMQQLDDLKHQLRALRAVAGVALEGDADGAGGNGTDADLVDRDSTLVADDDAAALRPTAAAAVSVEKLLLGRNRKLEHEVTMLKLASAESLQLMESTAAELATVQQELKEKEALVLRLEEDLLAAEAQADGTPMRGPGAAGGLPGMNGGDEDGSGEGGERTMLEVLCGQRDRYRTRVQELEEQHARMQLQLDKMTMDLKVARADNVALVERLRFVQGYQRQGKSKTDVERGLAVEGKYTADYEKSMDPFQDFRGREQESRKRRMGMADRTMYMVGHLVSGNRIARLCVFCYAVALHALVLLMIFRLTHHHTFHHYNSEMASVGSASITGTSLGASLHPPLHAKSLP